MGRKFELFKDRKGEFRWRLISSQKVIATSGEGYSKKAGARQGIRAVVKAVTGTQTECDVPVVDLTVKIQTKKVGKGTKRVVKKTPAKKKATK